MTWWLLRLASVQLKASRRLGGTLILSAQEEEVLASSAVAFHLCPYLHLLPFLLLHTLTLLMISVPVRRSFDRLVCYFPSQLNLRPSKEQKKNVQKWFSAHLPVKSSLLVPLLPLLKNPPHLYLHTLLPVLHVTVISMTAMTIFAQWKHLHIPHNSVIWFHLPFL